MNRIPKQPQILTAKAIFNTQYPDFEFLVPGFIPAQGLTLIVGPVKLGKSWFILQICLALSIGGYAVDSIEVKKQRGIYLSLEDTARRLNGRLHKISMPINDDVIFITNGLTGHDGLVFLKNYIEENQEIKYLVIDTLGRFSQGKGKSNFQDDYDWLSEIKELADQEGIAIVVIHHTRKMKDSADEFNEISGTTGLIAVADSLILLKRARHSTQGELVCTGRDFEEKKYAVEFSPESCRWSIKGKSTINSFSPERQLILKQLLIYGEMTPQEIGIHINKDPKLISNTLCKMLKEGLVVKGSRYSYWKAMSTEDASSISFISSQHAENNNNHSLQGGTEC
jgi:RecA-family ATPase